MNKKDSYLLAIKNERQSQKLYTFLKNSVKTTEAKQTFESLIAFEVIHEEKLITAYKHEFNEDPQILSKASLPQENKFIFDDPKSIIEFAIGLEDSAANLYKKLANESNGESKTMFEILAQEEENHHEILEHQISALEGIEIWFDESELNGLFED